MTVSDGLRAHAPPAASPAASPTATISAPPSASPELQSRPPVTLVAWEGVELLDLTGPGQVFAVAGFPVSVATVRPGTVTSQGFFRVEPTTLLRDVAPGGILVVPGGNSEGAREDAELLSALRDLAPQAHLIVSVCTGALVLAAAGILDGLEATTWHGALEPLRALAPRTRVVEGVRWVDNGRIITSAGVTAGIDASLHVVARQLGTAARDDVARYMELPETWVTGSNFWGATKPDAPPPAHSSDPSEAGRS